MLVGCAERKAVPLASCATVEKGYTKLVELGAETRRKRLGQARDAADQPDPGKEA